MSEGTTKLRAAIATALLPSGGLIAGVALGDLVFAGLTAHTAAPLRVTLAATPALAGITLGSGLWGMYIERLSGLGRSRRMALAGILGFVPMTFGLAVALQLIEPLAVKAAGPAIPIHRLFTLLFVPTAFLVGASMSFAIASTLRDWRSGRRLAILGGLAAAVAFLLIDLAMEAAGWKVGAPGAARRLTMLTVAFVGAIGAGFATGLVIGSALPRDAGRRT